MSDPTPAELKALRDGTAQLAAQGHAVAGLEAVYDLVSGNTEVTEED
jgi:hypothetical protein